MRPGDHVRSPDGHAERRRATSRKSRSSSLHTQRPSDFRRAPLDAAARDRVSRGGLWCGGAGPRCGLLCSVLVGTRESCERCVSSPNGLDRWSGAEVAEVGQEPFSGIDQRLGAVEGVDGFGGGRSRPGERGTRLRCGAVAVRRRGSSNAGRQRAPARSAAAAASDPELSHRSRTRSGVPTGLRGRGHQRRTGAPDLSRDGPDPGRGGARAAERLNPVARPELAEQPALVQGNVVECMISATENVTAR